MYVLFPSTFSWTPSGCETFHYKKPSFKPVQNLSMQYHDRNAYTERSNCIRRTLAMLSILNCYIQQSCSIFVCPLQLSTSHFLPDDKWKVTLLHFLLSNGCRFIQKLWNVCGHALSNLSCTEGKGAADFSSSDAAKSTHLSVTVFRSFYLTGRIHA